QGLPQYEGQKAHEDVGLNAIGALVPDRAHLELIFLDAKRRFGLSELDVGLPQLFLAPVADVGAQQIGAFRYGSPVVERCVDPDLEPEPCRAAVLAQEYLETMGGTLVLLQDTANLTIFLVA